MTDEERIRDLIVRWANAVHDGDIDAVLDNHAEDIVMFDVPPPQQGVRGIARTGRPGRVSSGGRPAARSSTSSGWTSPPATDVAFASRAAAVRNS